MSLRDTTNRAFLTPTPLPYAFVLFATALSTDEIQSAKSAAFAEQNRQSVYQSPKTADAQFFQVYAQAETWQFRQIKPKL
ncbi:MAG: hypothetical protein J5631_00890 [Spirochaetaceae bacterium]|nr:hypothetical protein [Spirochaetaceae bacterium]